LIESVIMRGDAGEILLSLKSICPSQWQLEVFDRDHSNEWRLTANAVGLHHHLLQMGLRYAADRIGEDAEPVEVRSAGTPPAPRGVGPYH
jgi:hypothetical protein